jgi:5-methylthioadenosine/S-adenosylhomocysteine deaminase
MPIQIDLLLLARWVVPIEPAGIVLENHAIAIRDGDIVDVLPHAEAREHFSANQTADLDEHVLLPGLINLHGHAAMSLMRGLADDLPLMTWLQEHIWPAEAKHVTAAFVRDGTLLAGAELLRGGVTCLNDMYFFPEASIESCQRLGLRLAAGLTVLEFPTNYAADADAYLAKGLEVRDRYRDTALVSFCLAPHAPYTVSDTTFERIATLSEQLNTPVHLHVHETRDEIRDNLKQYGVRPLARLERLGLLSPSLIAVHAVHLDAAEIDLLKHTGSHIAHCPSSNLKLASGIAPTAALQAAGVNIGLGTDSAASNNRLDVWTEMRNAALLAKGASGDATAVNAHQALAMATINGARALGLDRRIGSLAPGKAADLIAVRLDSPELTPCYDVASHLVYAVGREHVSHVWVNGEARVADGQLLGVERRELRQLALSWQNRLAN